MMLHNHLQGIITLPLTQSTHKGCKKNCHQLTLQSHLTSLNLHIFIWRIPKNWSKASSKDFEFKKVLSVWSSVQKVCNITGNASLCDISDFGFMYGYIMIKITNMF